MASNALAFDTHHFVKLMTAVGMPVQQAEALAESQADLLNANLATKNELANTEAALKVEIANTESVLSQPLKTDLTSKNIFQAAAQQT